MQPNATVTALVPRDGHIDLFAADRAGVVWSTWWEATPGWQPWFQIHGETPMAAGAPVSPLATRDGHIDLFAIDRAGVVRSTWFEAVADWQPWFSLP
jgi:hypothetical protein